MKKIRLRVLETPEDLAKVEDLQLLIWPGSASDVIPAHMLRASVHNGGLLIGAFETDEAEFQSDEANPNYLQNPESSSWTLEIPPIGFVFGIPGIYETPDGPRLKHHSHMLGVLPDYRDRGIGFLLKRAQWQMVRHQGLDRITWTYDPLLSRNAHLNITRLGAVCNTYIRNFYGEMRDEMNIGLPSDRFQVDWWVNTRRVSHRLDKRPRRPLDLAHYLAADVQIINPSQMDSNNLPRPNEESEVFNEILNEKAVRQSLLMLEIPADFLALKAINIELAGKWRSHTRVLFERLFEIGYLVTDFVHLGGTYPRSFYVLSHGESTL